MSSASSSQQRRLARFATLAQTPTDRIAGLWETHRVSRSWDYLRRPEIGLVMLQGRMGGDGAPFHCGEASVTRCTIRYEDGPEGHAMVLGRDPRKAELVALIDGAAQLDSETESAIENAVIMPLRHSLAENASQKAQETARTKVNFFTMVRGEDQA
jgi:alpha-D-ribose 1-methylphosphonate 5-triphosphate synthase subunit PhnG